MPISKLVVVIGWCCFASFLFAEVPKVVQVTASGVGETVDAAKNDARMNAVRKAAGSYIDSETLIRNDELVSETILESSGSSIKAYEVVGEPIKLETGLWKVELIADVHGGQLQPILDAVARSELGLDNADIATDALMRIKNAADGAAILEKQFTPELIPNLLTARLIDKNGQSPQAPTPVTKILADSTIEATWFVEIKFDTRKYKRLVVPQLDKVLSAISTSSGRATSSSLQAGMTQLTKYPMYNYRKWSGKMSPPTGDQAYIYFFLSVDQIGKGGSEKWKWYLLEGQDYLDTLSRTHFGNHWYGTTLSIDFLSSDKELVWSETTSPWEDTLYVDQKAYATSGRYVPYAIVPQDLGFGAGEPTYLQYSNVFISPRFGGAVSGFQTRNSFDYGKKVGAPSDTEHTDVIVKRFSAILLPEDLEQITEIQFQFSSGDSFE